MWKSKSVPETFYLVIISTNSAKQFGPPNRNPINLAYLTLLIFRNFSPGSGFAKFDSRDIWRPEPWPPPPPPLLFDLHLFVVFFREKNFKLNFKLFSPRSKSYRGVWFVRWFGSGTQCAVTVHGNGHQLRLTCWHRLWAKITSATEHEGNIKGHSGLRTRPLVFNIMNINANKVWGHKAHKWACAQATISVIN